MTCTPHFHHQSLQLGFSKAFRALFFFFHNKTRFSIKASSILPTSQHRFTNNNKNNKTMFNSTFELISLAASNPIFAFCFCNFIVAILLVGGSKSVSEFEFDRFGPVQTPTTIAGKNESDIAGGIDIAVSAGGNNGGNDVGDEARVAEIRVDEERQNQGSEEDDELRRRVEEFIDKINGGWKAEKLKAQRLRATLLV
ncbi:hypothetical protein U1Q18_002786 [Sarracenia purpurea var. burkii]